MHSSAPSVEKDYKFLVSIELCKHIDKLLGMCMDLPHSGDIDTILKDFVKENYVELAEDGVWDEIREQINEFIDYRKRTHRSIPYTPMNDNLGHLFLLYRMYAAANKSFDINIE